MSGWGRERLARVGKFKADEWGECPSTKPKCCGRRLQRQGE